jgi:hypothetical protein
VTLNFFSGGSPSDFTLDPFDNHADMNALPADFFGLLQEDREESIL